MVKDLDRILGSFVDELVKLGFGRKLGERKMVSWAFRRNEPKPSIRKCKPMLPLGPLKSIIKSRLDLKANSNINSRPDSDLGTSETSTEDMPEASPMVGLAPGMSETLTEVMSEASPMVALGLASSGNANVPWTASSSSASFQILL